MFANWRSFVPALVLLTACSGGGDDTVGPPRDGGATIRDAGPPRDAGEIVRDAGEEPPRDGGPGRDAGFRDGGPGRDGGFACAPPLIECGNDCVDPFEDEMHCGRCENVCMAPDTCLVGVCSGPPIAITTSVAPQLIGPGCDSGESQADTVALDAANNIYMAMLCGDDVRVARSSDSGATYTTPVSVGFVTPKDVTIVADGPGVVHAFAHTTANALVYARSLDFGETWSAPRIIDGGPVDMAFNRLRTNAVARRGFVAAAASDAAGALVNVYRNEASGSGAFLRTSQFFGAWGGNLALDPTNDDLLLVVESISESAIFRSTDRGASFARVFTGGVLASAPEYAVWPPYAYGACSLATIGAQADCFHRLDLTAMQSVPISLPMGFVPVYALGHGSVAVGTDGSAYFSVSEGTEMMPTAMALGRVAPTSTTLAEVRVISRELPMEIYNTLDFKIVPNTSAAVITFTTPAGVWATIELF